MPLHTHKDPECKPVLTMWSSGMMKAFCAWKADKMHHRDQILL